VTNSEPKIRFFEDLWGNRAVSLGWLNEIHVDESLKDHPHLDKLIAHEKKHIKYYKQYVLEKNDFRRQLITIENNLWDFFNCWKLERLFDKLAFCIDTAILITLIVSTILILYEVV
jgi:hypothetical protein